MTAIDLKIDAEKRRAELVYRDELNADGVIDAFEAITSHNAWRPNFSRLYIYGDEARMGDFRPDDRSRVLDYRRRIRPEVFRGDLSRAAHVCADPVKRTYLHFWIDILGETSVDRVRLFSSIEEAEAWLENGAAAAIEDGEQICA